jgi:hypothetical protein
MIAPILIALAASAVRTATLNSADVASLLNPQSAVGVAIAPQPPASCQEVIAYLNVTAVPGVDTVLLKMQELEPTSQTWVDVAGAATLAQVATGLIRLEMGLDITNVAASVTVVRLNANLPPNFRFVVVHSGAGNFTYSLTVAISASR